MWQRQWRTFSHAVAALEGLLDLLQALVIVLPDVEHVDEPVGLLAHLLGRLRRHSAVPAAPLRRRLGA